MSEAALILTINLVLGAVLLGAFGAAYLRDRTRVHYLWYSVAFSAGILSGLLELALPQLDSALVARFAIFASFLLCLVFLDIGLGGHFKVPVHGGRLAAVAVAGLCINVATLFMERNGIGRMALYQLPYVVLTLMALQTVRRSAERKPGRRILEVLLGLFALHFATRPVAALLTGGLGLTASDYLSTAYAVSTQFAAAILTIGLAVTLLGIAVADTLADLRARMRHDGLTGILNRQGFESAVLERLARSGRCCLVVCDLDNFKAVNDTFGHSAGDAVIKAFAETLLRSTRPQDICARIGGEEFSVLLTNIDTASARLFVEGLRSIFASVAVAGLPEEERFTASFGITEIRSAADFESAYARSDRALYAAKRGGRNRVEIAPEAGAPDRAANVLPLRAG